jgi:hypothetical protein
MGDEKGEFRAVSWRGSRAFQQMAEGDPKVTCSDCPLAAIQIEQGNGRRPLNPMQILAKSYRVKLFRDRERIRKKCSPEQFEHDHVGRTRTCRSEELLQSG